MNMFRFFTILWFTSFCLGFLTACSYTPVVDLRASKDEAQLFQRDLMECKELANQIDGFAVTQTIFSGYRIAVNKCIEGRGHSVLTQW